MKNNIEELKKLRAEMQKELDEATTIQEIKKTADYGYLISLIDLKLKELGEE